jgi:hypothetical protein
MIVFTPNTVIKSADVNLNFDQLQAQFDTYNAAWTTWTPTYVNITVGNGTIKAYYKQIGKSITARFVFTLGSTSAVSGNVRISYPVTPNADMLVDDMPVGYGSILNAGANLYPACCLDDQGLGINVVLYNTSVTYAEQAATNSAFVFGTGDRIAAYFIYEAA